MHARKAILYILTVVCLAAAVGCLFVACNKDDGASGTYAFICVDINPSVEIIVDSESVVLGISGENTDAKILLYNEGGLVGVPLNIALNNLMSLAVSCGYLGSDATNVGLSVASAISDVTFESVKQQLVSSASKCGAEISVSDGDEGDIALITELDMLKSQNPIYSEVSVERLRLMKRASSVSDFNQTYAMSVGDLIALIRTVWSGTNGNLDTPLARASAQARFAYEGARLFAKDSLYVTYFYDKAVNADNTLQSMQYRARTLYASRYAALHSAHEYLKHCREIIDDYVSNPFISDADLRLIYGLYSPQLQMSYEQFAAELQCAGEGVTAKNFNAFVNTLYRNAEPNAKARIAELYKTVKTQILDVFETEEVIGNTHAVLNDILAATVELTASDKRQGQLSDFETVDSSIFSFVNTDTLESLDASIQVLGEMTNAAYDDMKLSDAELSQIEALTESVAERVKAAQEKCAEKIEAYKLTAEQWLENAKDEIMPHTNRA